MEQQDIKNPKILVIVGTVREGRIGRTIADWYLNEAKKVAPYFAFELLDVKGEQLPVFNEPVPPMMHQYSSRQQKLAEKIASADGYVFVTGEYNHSIPGSLKNFIDYLFAEWNYKAAAFVGYGSVGGIRAIEHLIPVLAELKVASVANSFINITIPNSRHAIDDKGNVKPEAVHGNIEQQLKELHWWVQALKTARTSARE